MATLEDVSKHFNMTPQGLGAYIRRHLDEINVDGEHAKKSGASWILDSSAIKKLEELRGFGVEGVFDELETQKVKDRDIIISNLQTRLTAALINSNDLALKLVETEKERRMIAEKHVSEAAELATLRERTELQDKRERELQREIARLNFKIEEMSRPWWKRLFDLE